MSLDQPLEKNKFKQFLTKHWSALSFLVVFLLLGVYAIFELLHRQTFVDEILLIRVSHIQFTPELHDLRPQLVSPLTFLSGLLLKVFQNLKNTLLAVRLFDLSLLAYALWIVSQSLLNKKYSPFIFLVLFILHPFAYYYLTQARYDTSIFIISFLFIGLFGERRELGNRSLVFCAILLTSSIKGIYYAIPVLVTITCQHLFGRNKGERKKLGYFFLKLAGITCLILITFWISGVLDPFVSTFRHQIWLSTAKRSGITSSMEVSDLLVLGPVFYCLGAVSIVFLIQDVFRRQFQNIALAGYIFISIVLGWLYFVLHPISFAPMVIAGDLALTASITLMTERIYQSFRTRVWLPILLVCALTTQLISNPYFFAEKLVNPHRGFTLEEVENASKKADDLVSSNKQIFDPMGIAYKARPCSPEWLLDAPHRLKVLQKLWMSNIDWDKCDYVLYSVQFSHLDFKTLDIISKKYIYGDNYPLLSPNPIAR